MKSGSDIVRLLNGYFAFVLLWERRHVDFTRELELVYINIFKNVGVSRHHFNKLAQIGVTRSVKPKYIMHEIGDPVTSLCKKIFF